MCFRPPSGLNVDIQRTIPLGLFVELMAGGKSLMLPRGVFVVAWQEADREPHRGQQVDRAGHDGRRLAVGRPPCEQEGGAGGEGDDGEQGLDAAERVVRLLRLGFDMI